MNREIPMMNLRCVSFSAWRSVFFVALSFGIAPGSLRELFAQANGSEESRRSVVISTWRHGLAANEAAWKILASGGRALDAVEAGVRETESDPNVLSVGVGGLPDREGNVTLDACIMDEKGNCGSVAFLQHIEHPISVARQVMEKTQHVMLVGDGALQFAIDHGFERKELLTDKAKAEWEKWKAGHPEAVKERQVNVENHDTIGLLAIDDNGNLSGACTTSGMAWKLKGRVGDSPIIGAGLYVDNEVGAATATGTGEAVIRAVGSFLVVELMRQGHSPQDACRMATERVIEKNPDWKNIQVGFIALDKQGRFGGYCIQPGFNYAVYEKADGNRLIESKSRVRP
ncbi:MAG: N(4)-(beta-N-acetylglucosaminyl)-L-asparaginase [Planctomycetota bacterium]